MLQFLEYSFFTNALVGVLLLSVGAAIIGTYIITRRLVAICGGITHACFGGLGLGYFLGVSPVAMAGVFAVASSLSVEVMSRRFRLREDSAIAVVWALGMALGVLFVFMTPGYVPELNSFLFGNILTVNSSDIRALGIFTVLLGLFTAWQWRHIIAVAFDYDFAKVSGMPVRLISYSMTVFVALAIVLTIRLTGIMLLMSLLSLPVLTAEIFCRRYIGVMWCSMAVCMLTSVGGLFLSALVDVPCSALIVLVMVAVFLVAKCAYALLQVSRKIQVMK